MVNKEERYILSMRERERYYLKERGEKIRRIVVSRKERGED